MSFIEKEVSKYPDLSESYYKFGDLKNRKLYHQLTVELEKFISDPANHRDRNLIELYKEFIKPIESKLNQLKLAGILKPAIRQYDDPKEAAAFLEQFLIEEERIGKELIDIQLNNKLVPEAEIKKSLEETKKQVDELVGSDPLVHASHYEVACDYYKRVGPPESFYKNALMLLAYSPYESLDKVKRVELATDISLAALSGEGVFNFGEVLATPILTALEGTPNAWLSDLMQAFNTGDIDAFNAVIASNKQAFEKQPSLVNRSDYIKKKITLLALMDLIFHTPAHDRNISFEAIAERTRLPLEQVEWLVMNAMALKLIKGSIDQVEQTVSVTYVQARVLDRSQLSELSGRLEQWSKHVHETLLEIEDQTPELFQ